MSGKTKFVVDTRPLWVILLARSRPFAVLLLGVGVYWWVATTSALTGIEPRAQGALAVFALCVVYWVSGALPLMVTSLLAIVLLPATGVVEAHTAYALFGNEVVFFILGAFILAACLIKSKLSTRIALAMLARFGSTPRRLLVSILLLNASMSFFMSEHAVAAMNFPIVVEIATVLRLHPRRSSYGKALFLAMAWGTTIGGVATFLGGGRAPLAVGILQEATGASFSFIEWTIAILPLVFVLLAVAYAIITWFFPIDIEDVRAADEALRDRSLALGRVKFQEKAIGSVMAATVLAWIIGGESVGLANIALAAVVAVFALQLVTWSEIEGYVNWGVILMYGGAICLGAAMNQSGAAAWLAEHTISRWAGDGQTVVMLLSALSMLLTEAMSNSAVVAFMMPVSLGIAAQFAMDPRVMALSIAVPAGLAYTLPIGTPANAIAYSSGYLNIRDLILPGGLLMIVSWVAFMVLAIVYWPLLGISIAGAP